MKNTLLALMLVSSLFVISCGADATKPGDAYKNQPTETITGTTTITASVNAGVVQDFVTTPGEKATEIVQVVTVTTDTATTTTTTNTNAVTAIKQNADGGIYQFTIDSTTATTAYVTYKYIKREAAPMVEKETTGTYAGSSTSTLTINDVNFTDEEKSFDKNVVSVTDKYGTQLINDTEYTYYSVTDAVTIKKTGYYQGDAFTVRYTYRDISMISEKPLLTGNVTITDAASGVGGTATITLDAALYAGRSYYLKAVITDTPTGSGGTPTPTTETIYYNKIVPSTGIIDITLKTITQPSSKTTTGTYEIWVEKININSYCFMHNFCIFFRTNSYC